MAMKASYFVGKGSFEVRQAPELHSGAGEVVVRNKFCGVCGTDVHIFHGEPGSADVNPPVVLGHEYSGEIVEVGEGVTELQVGDHVTVDPNIYCGKCEHCRNGKKQAVREHGGHRRHPGRGLCRVQSHPCLSGL